MTIELLRYVIAAVFIITGLFINCAAVFGLFRFNFILNRMHIAAATDTLGLFLFTLGLIVLSADGAMIFKLILVVAFLWLASPVCSHLITKLEVHTNENTGLPVIEGDSCKEAGGDEA